MCAFEDEIFSKFVRTPTSHDPVDIFCSVLIQRLQLQLPPPSHLWRAMTSTALIKPNEGLNAIGRLFFCFFDTNLFSNVYIGSDNGQQRPMQAHEGPQ